MNTQQRPLAVVTEASSGIGFERSKVFAENGFDLLITGVTSLMTGCKKGDKR